MKKIFAFFTVISTISCITQQAVAEEDNGLSGSLAGGFMIIDSGNNLNPSSSSKRLTALDSSPNRQTNVVGALLPNITWDIGQADGVSVYFKTNPPVDEAGSVVLHIGASYKAGDFGMFDVGFFTTPFAEAWKDPFLVGENREETDLNIYGATAGLHRIMGSGLTIQMVYLTTDVDDDLAGARIHELSRDGSIYSLKMSYSYYLNENAEIRPVVSVSKGEYDGDANSFLKYKFGLESRFRCGQMFFTPSLFYSSSEHDETNPIFNKTQDEQTYGASLAATYIAPFGLKNWSLTGLMSVSTGNSNIDFYDTETTTAGAMVSYTF